ncbi:MAG: periplasmic heavy metal sensor [Sphingomonadales bacterium]
MKYKKIIYGTLLVSLAINLFFAGMMTVFLIKGPPVGAFGSADRFNMMAASEVLDPEYREVVDDIWSKFRSEQRGQFRSVFRLRRKLQEILLADEFDQKGFEAVFDEVQETAMRSRLAIIEVLREVTLALPPDQRKKYFQAGMVGPFNRGDFPDRDRERRRRPPPPEEEG